jgi:hypothetical protein
VTGISGAVINTTFTYDANGNQTDGFGRTMTWTSYDKPATITQGTRIVSFSHDTDHARFRQEAPEGTTLYFEAFGVRAELFSAGITLERIYRRGRCSDRGALQHRERGHGCDALLP